MTARFSNRQLVAARRLRRDMTVAETILWRALRNRGERAKFRRQVPIGAYVADFVCVAARLIVELDGPPHDSAERRLHDARRDAWLRTQGWRILRFSNALVIGGGDIVLDEIRKTLEETPSSDPR